MQSRLICNRVAPAVLLQHSGVHLQAVSRALGCVALHRRSQVRLARALWSRRLVPGLAAACACTRRSLLGPSMRYIWV